ERDDTALVVARDRRERVFRLRQIPERGRRLVALESEARRRPLRREPAREDRRERPAARGGERADLDPARRREDGLRHVDAQPDLRLLAARQGEEDERRKEEEEREPQPAREGPGHCDIVCLIVLSSSAATMTVRIFVAGGLAVVSFSLC